MEENTSLSCNPKATQVDNRYGAHYNDISSGCRLSSGLGIVTALALLFLIFALRNKRINALSDYIPQDVNLTSYPFERATITSNPGNIMRTSLLEAFNLNSFISPPQSISSTTQIQPRMSQTAESISPSSPSSPTSQSTISKRTISVP